MTEKYELESFTPSSIEASISSWIAVTTGTQRFIMCLSSFVAENTLYPIMLLSAEIKRRLYFQRVPCIKI